MRLLLIRHGETVDNVAGNYAGLTDSALTNHGFLQANRLGSYLAATGVKVPHIFSSDLQRAVKTAEAIRGAQNLGSAAPQVAKLQVLREQDFGFYEGKAFFERPRESNKSGKDAHLDLHRNDPGFKDVESKESMNARMDAFINGHLLRLFDSVEAGHTVVVVAHGIILSQMWRNILRRFASHDVSVEPGVVAADKMLSLEYLGGWSNTGYLDLEVRPKHVEEEVVDTTSSVELAVESREDPLAEPLPVETSLATSESVTEEVVPATVSTTIPGPSISTPPKTSSLKPLNMSLVVKAVNSMEHLKGLKKTRGGIGSLKHDSKQKTMDSFFSKKRKFEP